MKVSHHIIYRNSHDNSISPDPQKIRLMKSSPTLWAQQVLSGNTMGYVQAFYSGSSFNQFDVMFSNETTYKIATLEALKLTSVHEFGHVLGLGHTDIKPAVMFPTLNSQDPVDDDIQGCQSIYGAAFSSNPAPVCSAGASTCISCTAGTGANDTFFLYTKFSKKLRNV